MIDFRSDTVTRPTADMVSAMYNAPVGDDVFGEDPTINKLEQLGSEMFGMEAAIFVPSGTMSNQIAIKVHTQPGEDIICDYFSHIYQYEGGGIGMNAGCSASLIHSEKGLFTAKDVEKHIFPDDIHKPITRLVSLENTVNKGGGTIWDLNEIEKIKNVCEAHQLKYHLDGARLFNALVASHTSATDFGKNFDTISICLSKGLGAPVGSILLGSKKEIHLARRYRKALGGGMRQAGMLAAAGIYALTHHIKRLEIDHENARKIGNVLANQSWVKTVIPPETNIVLFEAQKGISDSAVIEKLKSKNILAVSMGNNKVRFVTHLDNSSDDIETVTRVLKDLF